MTWFVVAYLLIGLLATETALKQQRVMSPLWVAIIFVVVWFPFLIFFIFTQGVKR